MGELIRNLWVTNHSLSVTQDRVRLGWLSRGGDRYIFEIHNLSEEERACYAVRAVVITTTRTEKQQKKSRAERIKVLSAAVEVEEEEAVVEIYD